MLGLFTMLMTSFSSGAEPLSLIEAIAKIEGSYNSRIEFKTLSQSFSLYGCVVEEIKIKGEDPVLKTDREVRVSLYRKRRRPVEAKAVIVLPPTGGVNILDKGYANELCSSGLTVALVSQWENQHDENDDLDMHNRGALRALTATRHVVEFLRMKDFESIGLLGTSIGAITGALALEFEPRLSAAVLIVGSARFADVIAESDEAGAHALREKRMRDFGFKDAEEYRAALRDAIYVEPANFIERLKERKAFVITADHDITVPSSYQYELVTALNAAKHLSLQGSHLQVIKGAFFSQRGEIVEFFVKSL